MNEMDAALLCKVLGDSNRLRIVRMLSGGEKCACQLLSAFDITQPTLSHHMKILCDSGLVCARKDGKWMHYSLCRDVFAGFVQYLSNLSDGSEDGV